MSHPSTPSGPPAASPADTGHAPPDWRRPRSADGRPPSGVHFTARIGFASYPVPGDDTGRDVECFAYSAVANAPHSPREHVGTMRLHPDGWVAQAGEVGLIWCGQPFRSEGAALAQLALAVAEHRYPPPPPPPPPPRTVLIRRSLAAAAVAARLREPEEERGRP